MPKLLQCSTRTTPGGKKSHKVALYFRHCLQTFPLQKRFSRHSLFKEKGVKLAFVATRSGLTRWEEYRDEHLEEDYEDEVDSIQEP